VAPVTTALAGLPAMLRERFAKWRTSTGVSWQLLRLMFGTAPVAARWCEPARA
jgi:hypothetical protein